MQLIKDNQGAFSDDRSIEAMKPGASWSELADQQRADRETAQINANRQAFGQYIAIEQGAKQQQLALNHQRAIAGAAMIQSAFRNGGMSDRSLSTAFSQAFGQPIYGGQLVQGINMGNGPETVFAMYGAKRDPRTGRATIAPVAMLGSRDMVQILKRAGLGDTTNDLQNDIINNSYLGKLTDDQRAAMGVSRPSAPISTGTTVISGAAMRALRGTPRQRNMEGGHFAADGRGGFTQSYFNRSTGENWERNYGTRAPEQQGRWKVLESHADYTRYENDLTGEVVKVPKGKTVQDVLRGVSDKERIEQLKQENMNLRATMRQSQFDQKFALEQQKLEEQVQKRLAAAKSAEEKNSILKEAKEAELKLRQDEIESRYAQMGVQYGKGETRKTAQEKITEKLTTQPDDKATTKPGDNTEKETETKKDGETAKEIEDARKALLATGKYKIDEKTGKIVKK